MKNIKNAINTAARFIAFYAIIWSIIAAIYGISYLIGRAIGLFVLKYFDTIQRLNHRVYDTCKKFIHRTGRLLTNRI